MTTGLFILLRWALTFGVPLALAAQQLAFLRKAEDEKRALAAIPVPVRVRAPVPAE
jgi:hypothetical protein